MWLPNDDWYVTLFDDCKTKVEVIEKATDMLKRRDRSAFEQHEQTIDILRGHKSSLEIIESMTY
tara:strand:+ start:45 stop:236 length:192 start_codon:yes stop_codon:yes gene_type:complete